MSKRSVLQPIDPSILPRLDPEYVAFHNEHLQYIPPSQTIAWDPLARFASDNPFQNTSEKGVEGKNVRDIQLAHAQLRLFTPDGSAPIAGWPGFLWFHGGGWVLGSLDSDNGLCSRICKEANCVVINVNYRHAPEHPYPAAADDAFEALGWVHDTGCKLFSLNPTKIAIGGTSAGGNLTASLALRASLSSPPISIRGQILVVPVIDNTASVDGIWKKNQKAPWLTPGRMAWYRDLYFADAQEHVRADWRASPNLGPKELLAKSPKTWIAVAEMDLLAPEGLAYGELLKTSGVEVDVKVYEGCTHSILALSGYV